MKTKVWLIYFSLLLFLVPVGAEALIFVEAPPTPCFLDPAQPVCREPVLLVPGLVASHNRKCILKDRCLADTGTWNYTPSAGKWYKPLIERLEAEGYEEGKDLFVVFYDWRQTNLESVHEYLVPAIDKALANSLVDKVDIVAHSMGGLVSRAYAQSDTEYRDDIDDLVLAGTPNLGAASAYTVWESGVFPESWNWAAQQWILRINRALRKQRDVEFRPPESFRAFFPSLRDLIPISDFVKRGGVDLAMGDLNADAQNSFLATLDATKNRLGLEDINVTTIAGTNVDTLSSVPVSVIADRTKDDIDLARWRDGHATPDPPKVDSELGDQTVLASSVHALGGTNHNKANVKHEDIIIESQEEILAAISDGVNPIADFVPSKLASSSVGVDVLSPAMPVITGPNGAELSSENNTFPEAVFDWDPENPEDPKLLTIIDPPAGAYTVVLTGTDNGVYDLAATFADQNTLIEEEANSEISTGQQHVYNLFVGQEELNLEQEVVDIGALLEQIIDLAYEAKDNDVIRGYERANLTRPASKAINRLDGYEQRLERGRERAAMKRLESYWKQLDSLQEDLAKMKERGVAADFTSEIQRLLDLIFTNSPQLNQARVLFG